MLEQFLEQPKHKIYQAIDCVKIKWRWLIFFLLLLPSTVFATDAIALKQKIGQMLIIGFDGSELKSDTPIVKAILNQQIGGVILFDFNYQKNTYDKNIKTAEQLRRLTGQLQAYTKQAALEHHDQLYPLIISIDYEGGHVNRLKEQYGFPKTLEAQQIGRLPLAQAQQIANRMADTLKTEGINLDFAPVLDININPNNPVIGKLGRSFSNDPNKVIQYADVFSKAFYNHNILCSYKHFPGHGSSTKDSHEGFVEVTDTWQPEELAPYHALFSKPESCEFVMMAHLVNKRLDPEGYPASLSKTMIEMLRHRLHFHGVVISDDMQMKAITDHYSLEDAVKRAINAGDDMLIFDNQLITTPQDPKEIVDIIYKDVQTGQIPEARINEAFQRIMHLKAKLQS